MRLRSLAVAVACTAAALAVAGPASAWAPAGSAKIHPGVQTFTQGGQCTANFIFSDGATTYIGQAAHCSGTDGNTATNGCTSGTLPTGTAVEIGGASRPGVMVYNSWATMQAQGETDPNVCQYNDLALVKIDPADVGKVNPSVPHWGGPNGLVSTVPTAMKVYSYGNSELRFGITRTSPKQGYSLGQSAGGWTHRIYTLTPGIPGDSGSGFLNKSGKAFGILSTVAAAPYPASNGVGDLSRELGYLHTHTGFTGVNLVNGTQPFVGGLK